MQFHILRSYCKAIGLYNYYIRVCIGQYKQWHAIYRSYTDLISKNLKT